MDIPPEIEMQINEFMAEEFRKFILDSLIEKDYLSRHVDIPYLGEFKVFIQYAPRDENGIIKEGVIIFKRGNHAS